MSKIVPADQLELTRIRGTWPEVARGQLRTVAWPTTLRDGTLTLAVLDNQWLHELSYLRHDLLRRLQQRCPRAGIADLRLRVGQVHVPPDLGEPPEAPPPPALPDEPPRETREALQSIEDAGLRQTIANARMALSQRLRG